MGLSIIATMILIGTMAVTHDVYAQDVEGSVRQHSLQENGNATITGTAYEKLLRDAEALMKNGMGSGPALALLLAGPALSIPSILVIRSVLGNLKTLVFVTLVVIMSTLIGMGYGRLFPENPVLNTPGGSPVAVSTMTN